MNRLITAEYRKVFTTKLWWALLIPAAALSLAFTWGGAALGALGDIDRELGGVVPLALPAFAQGINFASVFGLILGGTAVTGEIRHKTITTSYLTGPTRGAVLAAKLFVYSTIGAVYGLVCMLAATLGALLGNNFPDTDDWFTLAGAGVVAMVMWTLLGVGVGALIGNQVGTTVGLIVYVLIIEPIISVVLRSNDAGHVPPYLLNTSGSNMVTDLSLDLFFAGLPGSSRRNQRAYEDLREFLSLTDSPQWWVSGLIFVGYAVALGLAGWLVARRRDIT
ncbi:ABC transporter permease [Kibdelosporangium persicum]|uniref:ABC transporter permease n=1 Tax=Kibdelosporangium persicum TaxID=2698649 RepID=A0ABX2F0N8_9PSEU|nr:ABC transporter permease subunit [Kibdelosporangium persicum]NRN64871.1 ABC transporter permease [Kibdelosporangium persicum]